MARKRRKKRIDESAERIKKHLQEGGYEVANAEDFFSGIDSLYRKPTVEQVVEEELSTILDIDPNIFIRNQIDMRNIPQQLSRMYQGKDLKNVHWSFKVAFRHVRFFLRDAPEENELLEETIEQLKLIFNGRFIEEELLVKLFYIHAQGNGYYEDYQRMKKELKELYCKN